MDLVLTPSAHLLLEAVSTEAADKKAVKPMPTALNDGANPSKSGPRKLLGKTTVGKKTAE
ncbi:MAG TPA: hypothetical protein DD670_10430 [Planctomycetaceae bacterium]|nr:hypothetical protein [Planctomycetaceae bacterium]